TLASAAAGVGGRLVPPQRAAVAGRARGRSVPGPASPRVRLLLVSRQCAYLGPAERPLHGRLRVRQRSPVRWARGALPRSAPEAAGYLPEQPRRWLRPRRLLHPAARPHARTARRLGGSRSARRAPGAVPRARRPRGGPTRAGLREQG